MKHTHKPKTNGSLASLHKHRGIAKNKLKVTITITGIVMIIEAIGGILTNSLSLLSDAGHMFTHFFALAISFGAIVIAGKEPCHHRTFGFYRAEILAALFNSLFLFGVTAYIFYEGVKRLIFPEPVLGIEMFSVAVLGLIVNLVSVFILRGNHQENLNVKGAFLHMIADTASSIVIVIGAVIIYFTQWFVIDAILSIGISLVILFWAWGLFKDSINILLESAPKGITTDEVCRILKENIKEIKEIQDIHIWEITSKMYAMTAHIRISEIKIKDSRKILKKINKLADEKYDIEYTTIQFEV